MTPDDDRSRTSDASFTRPKHAGVGYVKLLRRLHAVKRPNTYLEIGSAAGKTLALARCASIAIDPRFRLAPDVRQGGPGGEPDRHSIDFKQLFSQPWRKSDGKSI